MNPVWQMIDQLLDNIENIGAYYAGGTLFVPFAQGKSVALNIEGSGFVLGSRYSHMKDSTLRQPTEITEKVRELYLKYRGQTNHYAEVVHG